MIRGAFLNKQVANVRLMQKINRLKVLNSLIQNPSISKPAISEMTGLSKASVTNIISFLLEKGLVCEMGREVTDKIGRKAVMLKFCATNYNLVCVNITREGVGVYLTTLDGEVISSRIHNAPNLTSQMALSIVKEEIHSVISNSDSQKILAVGISVSALLMPDGTLAVSSKFRWDNVDFKGEIQKEINKPVFVMDTSSAKAYYCSLSDNEKINSMLFVDLKDGVGAVNFYKGHINKSIIGEIGHTTVEKDGDMCFCGNRGCLETMCSIERVCEQYQKSGKGNNLDDVINGFEKGDKTATELLTKTGEYLGIGIANAINIINPNKVIINKGEWQKSGFVLETAVNEAKKRAFSAISGKISFETADIDDIMTVKGMSKSLCESIFDVDFHGDIFD